MVGTVQLLKLYSVTATTMTLYTLHSFVQWYFGPPHPAISYLTISECVYAMLFLVYGLHLGGQTFWFSSTTQRRNRYSFIVFLNSPAFTLSMKYRITLCSYYVQLPATLCEQRRAIVHECVFLRLSQFRELDSKKPSRYWLEAPRTKE